MSVHQPPPNLQADLHSVADLPVRASHNPLLLDGHLPALDGIRGLAILLVLLVHFTPDGESRTLVGAICRAVAQVGPLGVDLFFVLSGFLITGILFDAKPKPRYFRTFYARRGLRIFPLYYGVLIVSFLIVPLFHRNPSPDEQRVIADQGWLWVYANNIKTSLTTFHRPFHGGWYNLDHFWSLAVEEHFYLLWPLAVFCLGRRALIGVAVGLIAAALGLRWALYANGCETLAFYVLTPCRMDQLAIGATLALLARGPTPARTLVRAAWVALAGSITILALTWNTDARVVVTSGTLVGLVFGAVLVLIVNARPRNPFRRAFDSAPMRFFGKYSYGMYVLHPIVLTALAPVLLNPLRARLGPGPTSVAVIMFVCFIVTIAAALLSWHLFEKHFLRLKRFFDYRPTKSAAPTSVVPAPAA